MKFLLLLTILSLDGTFAQMRSTWPPWARPGENCLEYDGSIVPDCTKFVDPVIKEPYYHPHSSNCSRFWECGPSYETCLFECAHCGVEIAGCQGQEALSFDPQYQYPVGPVCDWPSNINCTNTGGCISNDDCPSDMCDEPWPYNTCTWCDTQPEHGVCTPGCPDDSKCPVNKPICGASGQPHRCGCNDDSDCKTGDKCSDNECVTPDCTDNTDCKDGTCDIVNTPDYLECQYCEDQKCKPGCIDDNHCPEGYRCHAHICEATEGKTLLKSIKIYSTSCTDCTTEGLKLTLNGEQNVVNKVQCNTNNLDHNNVIDYEGGAAVFDDKLTLGAYTPDGGCLSAPLGGAVSDSEWKWTGEGTWEGNSVCVEWFGDDVFAVMCTIVTGGKITDCQSLDGISCP